MEGGTLLQRIIALRARGLTVSAIADELGVTKGVVAGKLHRANAPPAVREFKARMSTTDMEALRERGVSVREIARRAGVSRSSVQGRLHTADRQRRKVPGEITPQPAGFSLPGAIRVAPSGPAAVSGRPNPTPAEVARRNRMAASARRDGKTREIEGRYEMAPPARLAELPPGIIHRTCQWINGDPLKPGWSFCGTPTASGSYCGEHYLRCYAPRVREAA